MVESAGIHCLRVSFEVTASATLASELVRVDAALGFSSICSKFDSFAKSSG